MRVPGGLPRVRPGIAVTRPARGHPPGAADTRDRDGRLGKIFGNTESRETTYRITRTLKMSIVGANIYILSRGDPRHLPRVREPDAGQGPGGDVCRDAGGGAQPGEERERRARGPATGTSTSHQPLPAPPAPVTQRVGTEEHRAQTSVITSSHITLILVTCHSDPVSG